MDELWPLRPHRRPRRGGAESVERVATRPRPTGAFLVGHEKKQRPAEGAGRRLEDTVGSRMQSEVVPLHWVTRLRDTEPQNK